LSEPSGAAALLPPRATYDGTYRRVLEAALELFADRGYHGVSMRDLAAAAGIRASSLYSHVPSKERLLYDLVLLGHEEHRALIRQALLEAGDDPADQLRAVMRGHVLMHAAYPTLATVCNNELHVLDGTALDAVLAIRRDAEDTIAAVIERGVRLGRFDCPDTWLAAAAIGAMGIRVAAWFPHHPAAARYGVDDVADRDAELALRIVGAIGATISAPVG